MDVFCLGVRVTRIDVYFTSKGFAFGRKAGIIGQEAGIRDAKASCPEFIVLAG